MQIRDQDDRAIRFPLKKASDLENSAGATSNKV